MTPELEKYRDTKFHELTVALRAALRQIRADPSLPPTVAQVAQMAGCSRGLLYTDDRSWAAQRVKRIARARHLREEKTKGKNAEEVKDDSNIDAVLQKMRLENAEFFHKNLALESELQEARDEIKQLARDLKSCEEQLYALREQVRQTLTASSARQRTTNR